MERLLLEDTDTGEVHQVRAVELTDGRRVYARHVMLWNDEEHAKLNAMVKGWTLRVERMTVMRWQWKVLVAAWGFVVTVSVIATAVAAFVK